MKDYMNMLSILACSPSAVNCLIVSRRIPTFRMVMEPTATTDYSDTHSLTLPFHVPMTSLKENYAMILWYIILYSNLYNRVQNRTLFGNSPEAIIIGRCSQ